MKKKQVILSAAAMIIAGFMSTVWGALAVDFGGNYRDSNVNTTTENRTLTLETGDYDFAGASNDRRGYRSMDSSFITVVITNDVGVKNNIFNAGVQIANFNSDTAPNLGLYRYSGSTDAFQVTSDAGTTSMGLAFAPYVTKANFLNGQDIVSNLRFEDAANSISFNIRQFTSGQTARALVKSGSSWYVSASEKTGTEVGGLSLNGYTETWYEYDPSNNLFLNTANLGTGVSGSTLTDIQAFGVFMQGLNFNGTNANAANFQIDSFQASVIPEPATLGLFVISAGLLVGIRHLRQ